MAGFVRQLDVCEYFCCQICVRTGSDNCCTGSASTDCLHYIIISKYWRSSDSNFTGKICHISCVTACLPEWHDSYCYVTAVVQRICFFVIRLSACECCNSACILHVFDVLKNFNHCIVIYVKFSVFCQVISALLSQHQVDHPLCGCLSSGKSLACSFMVFYTGFFKVIPGLDSCVINSCCFQFFCIIESNGCTNVCRESVVLSIFGIQIQSGFYNFVLIWSDSICQIHQTDIANHEGWEFTNLDIYYIRSAFAGFQGQ